MKIKGIYILVMIVIAILIYIEQSKAKPSIWIQIIGIVVFFYGMMRLSAKTPSKNPDKEE